MQKTLNIGHNHYFVRPEYYNKLLGSHPRMSRRKAKRFRIAFTTEQINYMEEKFKKFPYINSSHRQEIAETLNIPEKAVKVWFQNRRMKEKKDTLGKEINIQAKKLIHLDVFDNKSGVNRALNDEKKGTTSLCYNINNFNYGEKMTKSVVSSSNSEISIDEPTALQPHCSKSSPDCSKLDEFVKLYGANFENQITNQKRANPVFNTHPIMKSNSDEKRNDDDKSKEQKPIEESLNPNMNELKVGQIRESDENSNDPRYIFMVPDVAPQMQPYYPTGGIFWNPINIVPTVNPVNVAVKPIISNSVSPVNQEKMSTAHGVGAANSCCFCNCHNNTMPKITNLQGQSTCPQFIISALQLPSSRTFS